MPGQNAEKQASGWDEKMPEKNARPKSLKKTLALRTIIITLALHIEPIAGHELAVFQELSL